MKLQDEEEKYVEDQIASKEDIEDDETKDREVKKCRLEYYSKSIYGPEKAAEGAEDEAPPVDEEESAKWREELLAFKHYKVIKMPRIW